jgi:hypothetical protein
VADKNEPGNPSRRARLPGEIVRANVNVPSCTPSYRQVGMLQGYANRLPNVNLGHSIGTKSCFLLVIVAGDVAHASVSANSHHLMLESFDTMPVCATAEPHSAQNRMARTQLDMPRHDRCCQSPHADRQESRPTLSRLPADAVPTPMCS